MKKAIPWKRWAAARNESRSLTVHEKLLREARGTWLNATGIAVNPRSALGLPAAFAAINVIATDVSCLPLRIYRRLEGGGRVESREHPLWDALTVSLDAEVPSMRTRQALMGHTLGWGNGYLEIGYTRGGRAARLYPLTPGQAFADVTPISKKLYYQVEGESWSPSRIFHLAGFGFDGVQGYSPIALCRQAVGLGIAAETYGAGFFGGGSKPGGVIQVPGSLGRTQEEAEEAMERIRSGWEKIHQGSENSARVAVLEGGSVYQAITIDPKDAQFLETRQFQVLEICRLYRVPPNKLMDLSQAHLANLEFSNLDYMQTTLMPWCEAWEQEANLKLLTAAERSQGYYIEHNMNAYLRGDTKARAEYYQRMRDLGALSPDEIRQLENLNPIGRDRGGDKYLVPLNMTTLEAAGQIGEIKGQSKGTKQ